MIEKPGRVGARKSGMDMNVDQTGEQGTAVHVDDVGIRDPRRTGIDRRDPAVFDDHMAIFAITVRRLVQHAGIFKYDYRQLLCPHRS